MNKEILSFRIKNYHFICAHISLMLERVKLIELDHDINLSIIKLELETLVKKSFLLRNSIMKIIPQIEQNILRTNTDINIQQKYDMISKLRQQYTDVLTKLVDELKTYSRKAVLQT